MSTRINELYVKKKNRIFNNPGKKYDYINIIHIGENVNSICFFPGMFPNLETIVIHSPKLTPNKFFANFSSFNLCTRLHNIIFDYDDIISCEWFKLSEHYNLDIINNSKYVSENNIVYTSDMKWLVKCSPNVSGHIIIPDGVKKVCFAAFMNCNNITSISIPNTVMYIEEQAFSLCSSIEKIIVPEVFYIGDRAFSQCTALKTLILPKYLSAIPEGMCFMCRNLGYVRLPEYLDKISDNAFALCDSLTSIHIPGFNVELGYNSLCCPKEISFDQHGIPINFVTNTSKIFDINTCMKYKISCIKIITRDRKFYTPLIFDIRPSANYVLSEFRKYRSTLEPFPFYEYGATEHYRIITAIKDFFEFGNPKAKSFLMSVNINNIYDIYYICIKNNILGEFVFLIQSDCFCISELEMLLEKEDTDPAIKAYIIKKLYTEVHQDLTL